MSVFAVVSEFNPFHNGHKYLLSKAREKGADEIVCVMSGNSVERGETAVAEKHVRAKAALLCGADLVLELPFPWCSAGAEAFAACSVKIASEFADTLIFGSECGELSYLSEAADICADKSFIEEYKKSLLGSNGSAALYFDLLSKRTGRSYSSNDILGIEYIKAAKRMGSPISFETVKREGGAYSSDELCEGDIQSASAIRAALEKNSFEAVKRYMPEEMFLLLVLEAQKGYLCSPKRIEDAVRLFFRLKDPSELYGIAELDEGLAHRICRAASERASGDMLEALRTKRYTDARLRRAMLFAMTGVKREDIRSSPAYVNLLGANARGRDLLAKKRKTATIDVLAKSVDIPNTEGAQRQAELSACLDMIFSMTSENKRVPAELLRIPPVIM